ncbi:MAG TPA: GH92 family glycosyl hydrolase [Clostridia bacterium]|nr:GH92 family glycosyl hydrolase [Clostridia bacterium]
MLAIAKRLQGIVMVVAIIIASLFTSGELPRHTEMPEKECGEFGQWVDPFIGTGGIPWACAMLFPGATTPYGMVRLSPDTTFPGGLDLFKFGTAGYYYPLKHIWGFSHTRLSGTGATDMGHFRVTPAVGNADPTKRLNKPLIFSHDNEEATTGYYAVNLPSINCLAELTSTTHTGVHRYTFNTQKDAHVFIDATSFLAGGSAYNGKIKILPDAMEVEGEGLVKTSFTGRYGGLKGYFVARFNKPFESFSTWSDGISVEGQAESFGDDAGADINFGNIKNQPIELKLGISFVSLENARQNLDAETQGLDFDGVKDKSRNDWDSWLSRIKIETDNEEIKTIFYTALYHSMIMPTDFTDVNGQYLGFKNQVGTADGFTYRTDMSIWDTFRTVHPLLNIIAPEIQRDCLKSLVRMARIGSTLPRWPSGAGYTGSMFGTPADMVIAESYLKGITDFEVEEAYNYMKKTSLEVITGEADCRSFNEEYLEYGYCPSDLTNKSVSRTLEYSWADGSIALLANALGKRDEAEFFTEKSMAYKNVFNPKTKYFHPRKADGSWEILFSPHITSYYDEVLFKLFANAYCEGGARHWRWTAPHDPQGLVELFGKDYFISELEDFMSDASKNRAAIDPGSGYWQGNQHDIHAPYLFNDAGHPELTQKWVRWALTQRHSTDVDGLDGNDDGGTLSAWYVLSAMGIYPVAGTDRYWIGAPIIDRAEVNLGQGKTLTIIANNQSLENMYVQSVTLNGEKLDSPYLTHSQFSNGATLVFTMGNNPAKQGGY